MKGNMGKLGRALTEEREGGRSVHGEEGGGKITLRTSKTERIFLFT